MEELLHHLRCKKTRNLWDIYHINWWISSINSTLLRIMISQKGLVSTWRIIAVSKWLITMVTKSSQDRVVPLPNVLFMAYKRHLLTTSLTTTSPQTMQNQGFGHVKTSKNQVIYHKNPLEMYLQVLGPMILWEWFLTWVSSTQADLPNA